MMIKINNTPFTNIAMFRSFFFFYKTISTEINYIIFLFFIISLFLNKIKKFLIIFLFYCITRILRKSKIKENKIKNRNKNRNKNFQPIL